MIQSVKFLKGSLALALAIQLAACGDKAKQDGSVKPLSTSERQQVLGVVKSTVRSVGAATKALNNQQKGKLALNLDSLLKIQSTDDSSDSSLDDQSDFGAMSSELDECTMGMSGLEAFDDSGSSFNPMDPINGSFTATGEKCPIQIKSSFSTKSASDGKSVSGSVSFDYQVVNAEYKKLNDVDAINFNLQMSASQSSENSGSATLTLSSTLHSQKAGNISVKGSLSVVASQNSASLNSKIELTLGSTSAVFEIKAADLNKGTPEILLNGQKLSNEELQYLFSDLNDSSESSSGGKNSPSSSPVSTPASPAPGSTPVARPGINSPPHLGIYESTENFIVINEAGKAVHISGVSGAEVQCSYVLTGLEIVFNCMEKTIKGRFSSDFMKFTTPNEIFEKIQN